MMTFKELGIKYFSPSNDTGNRVNNFNIIRIIAAAMVIYGHMCHIMGVPVYCIYGQAVSTVAVKTLFVISGYLIMKSYMNDPNFFRYMVRRSFRIFPGLIGVVLFAIFIIGPVFTALPIKDYFLSVATWQYLRNIVLYPIYTLPGVFGNYTYPNAINGSLWTLPVEFLLYILLPAILWLFKKLKITKLGLLSVCIICIIADCYKLLNPELRIVFYGSNWMDSLAIIPYFFIGSFLALPEFEKIFNLQIASLFMILLGIFTFNNIKYELAFTIILPYFVLSFALTKRPVFSKWFEKSDISYGLYLYGFIIQQAVFHQLQKLNSPYVSLNITFLICFILTTICAYISYYLIEKPLQNVGKKIVSKSLSRDKSK